MATPKRVNTSKIPATRSIFVAYPYRLYAKNNADYRAVYIEIEKAYKVKFIFADNEITSRHILEKIRGYIQNTAFGIYDISSWNPNVTLELGLAFGVQKEAFIAVDPSKHKKLQDVPADLGGIDRFQYSSFAELRENLLKMISGKLPILRESTSNPIDEMQQTALKLFTDAKTGLAISDIAKALGVSPQLARMAIQPLIGTRIRTTGAKRGTKYFKVGLRRGRPKKINNANIARK